MPRLLLCAALVCLVALPMAAGLVGPNSPVRVDTNGNGVPDAGDYPIVPTVAGTSLTIPNPWQLSTNPLNVLSLSRMDANYRYRALSRTNKGRLQTGDVDQVSADGLRALHVTITAGALTGGGGLADLNGDGKADAIQGSGPLGAVDIPLVFLDTNGDGFGDHVSIPWAQASALGVNTADGIADPQVWIPMGNTSGGTGAPDGVALDLDGNGVPDPTFLMSPILGPAVVGGNNVVPAVGSVGLIAIALALAAIALVRMRGTLGLGA